MTDIKLRMFFYCTKFFNWCLVASVVIPRSDGSIRVMRSDSVFFFYSENVLYYQTMFIGLEVCNFQ